MIKLEKIRFTSADDESGAQGGRTIIDGMNYTFENGKFYAITGPNGSGKTTLAKLMMGIFPLTSGTLILDGEDVSSLSISERAKQGIAYSFQHPARFKGMTFRQLLTIAAGTDDENKLVDILARVGICSLDYLEKDVDTKLSGGEIKKIELATTIARNSKVAIYDEPDTGIDLWTIGPMVDLIKRECRDRGTTTIVISHNKAFLEVADQLLLIKAGEIAYDGDYLGVKPILEDLSACEFTQTCEGEGNAGCYR